MYGGSGAIAPCIPNLDITRRWMVELGTAVAQWLRCCATNRKVTGSISASVSGFFIDIKSFRSHYGPGVDSASNRNECQERFLGGKGGRCIRLTTLQPSCAVVVKSGNLNFLEPSGPLQVYNGNGWINAWITSPLRRNPTADWVVGLVSFLAGQVSLWADMVSFKLVWWAYELVWMLWRG